MMSKAERNELTEAIAGHWASDGASGFALDGEDALVIADTLTAAGYRKCRTITTISELDALPSGSIIREGDSWPMLKVNSWWERGPDEICDFPRLPATVLWEPNVVGGADE